MLLTVDSQASSYIAAAHDELANCQQEVDQ